MKARRIIALFQAVIMLAVVVTFIVVVANKGDNVLVEGADLKVDFQGELERDVVIRVLENDTAIKNGYFKTLLEAFNEKYAEYGIVAQDANTDQYSDLEKDGPYGYGPDVLYQANDVLMKYVKGRHILPLPIERFECFKQIPQVAWDAYEATVYDKQYTCAIPVNIQSPIMYYRKDMLPTNWKTAWDDNANDIPDMFETWNKMYEYSKSIRQNDSTKYGYMKSIIDVYFSSGYLFSYGGYIFGDNNTNPRDIGFSGGNAALGGNVIRQLASQMNEGCIDFTVTNNSYANLANGTYFATMTTPDVYTLFIKELVLEYVRKGMTTSQAEIKAQENLGIADLPMLPKSGDLTEKNPELIPCKMMGGINGYAISSYTESPNACFAFVDFATSYEMMMERNRVLGITPARADAVSQVGGYAPIIYKNLAAGNTVIMPSIREVGQIWSPAQTFFSDLAKDPFRKPLEMKYTSLELIKNGLVKVDENIYSAIFTLA